jgi:hypothetical protein
MTAGISDTLLFSFKNYADSGVYSELNASPQDWTDELPLSNLADRQLTKVARSTNLQPDFIIDLTRKQSITFFALLAHNITTAGTWRVRVSNAPDFSTIIYDSGVIDLWPVTQAFGSLPWGGFVWDGKFESDDANNGILTLDTSVFGRYILVNLSDPSNIDAYLEAGRFIIDAPWRPTRSVRYGWGVQWSQRSGKSRSRGGQVWSDVQAEYRTLTFDLAGMSEDEMYGQSYEIDRIKGITGDVFVMVDPLDSVNRHKYSIYGTQASANSLIQRTHKDFAHPFAIEESL